MMATRTTPGLMVDTIGGEVQDGAGVEAIAFGVFASGAMRGGATLERCRAMFKDLPLEDRARWLQRGRDTITYALSYVP